MATQLNGIQLGTNFLLQSEKPLDARQFYNTIEEMVGMEDTSLYEGITAYVKETDCTYQFKSSNEVDPETGKWRLFGAGESESKSKLTIIEGSTSSSAYKFNDNVLTAAQYNTLIKDGTLTVGSVIYAYTPATETDGATVNAKFTVDGVEVVPEEVEGSKEFAKVYEFYQGALENDAEGNPIADEKKLVGKVNIPLDMVVSKGYYADVVVDKDAGTAVYYPENDSTAEAIELDYVKFGSEKGVIVLEIANKEDDKIIIPVSDLKNDEKEVKVYETFEELPTENVEIDTLAYVKNPINETIIGTFYDSLDENNTPLEDSFVVEIEGAKYSINGADCASYKNAIESKNYEEAKNIALASSVISQETFDALTTVKNRKYNIIKEERLNGLYVFDGEWKTNSRGSEHWIGTKAEYEAAKDTIKVGTVVIITDDDEETPVIDFITDEEIEVLF